MANPPIAERRIITIERVDDHFEVAVVIPPAGIWRQIGQPLKFDSYSDASGAAALRLQSWDGSLATSFEVYATVAGIIPIGGPNNG